MDEKIWQSVLGELELTVPSSMFVAFFSRVRFVRQDDNVIVLSVHNVFAKSQIESRYKAQIIALLEKNGIPNPTLRLEVGSSSHRRTIVNRETTASLQPKQPITADDLVPLAPTAARPSSITAAQPNTTLNPRYTFDNFIVGSSNDLAFNACQAVARTPGTKYNPLFLYGGVGLGKTHLIQAVGNYIAKANPRARVLYISTETFVKEFLDSIYLKKNNFSDKYRNVDVLIVDDMQFIAGKEKTQEEFFHTFNALHQHNKQIIISSDQPPHDIPTLTDRLRSRFAWGMAIDIQLPDFETRCAIIKAKANLAEVELDGATIDYIASNIKTNVRELEGTLNQILAFSEMRGITPDVSIAEGLIGSARTTRPQHITPKQIVEKTARYFSIDYKEITSAKRSRHIAMPRHIAMYLLRSELHLSFPKIAQELGRKDHTTAIHSVEKIETASKLDIALREQLSEIRDLLHN